MEQWKEYKISEIIEEIAMGPFGSNIKVDNFIDSGIPVLNGSNLQGIKLNEDSFLKKKRILLVELMPSGEMLLLPIEVHWGK